MNASNRGWNRAVLVVAGLLLAVGGLLLLGSTVWPDVLARLLPGAAELLTGVRSVVSAALQDPGAVVVTPSIAGWAGAGLLVLLILLLWFLATRGGGRTTTVLRAAATAGTTTVDRSVAADMLNEAMRACPGVLAVQLGAYRVRRQPALILHVTTQRGAVLSEVVARAETAVEEWDALIGSPMPVVLHLAGPGLWHRWRSVVRVR